MNDDLSVMEDLRLTGAEQKDLEKEIQGPGMYCQGCGRCLKSCPARLPVPDLMRAYMYTYGYRQASLAQCLLDSHEIPENACKDCSECLVECSNGWNVGDKIRDIIRLKSVPSDFLA
jgi:ferredoxin